MDRMEKDGTLELDESQKQAWKVGKRMIALLCVAGVISCTVEDGGSEDSRPAAPKLEQLEGRIADDAIMLMDRESFGDTYAKLGAENFQKANDLTHWAAIAAAEHKDACDRVAMINLSDRSTREQIVWFADCENKERVFIDQMQAEDAQRRLGKAS